MAKRKTYRKVITSPELMERINPKNKALAERFLKNFATKRSPKSVVVYRSNLNIFFCYCVEHLDNVFFVDLKKSMLLDFFDYCVTTLKWNSARFSQMHSCLSSLSTFVEDIYDDVYPNYRNLLPKIEKLPKEFARKKSVFTKDEIDKLMNWLGEIGKPQEQCLLALMTSSGARASELARFTTTIIDENNTAFDDLFLETTEEVKIKGRGVNAKSKLRYILKDTFLPYYHKWLPIREQIMKENGKEHDYIFINQFGEPATDSTFRGWVEKWDNVLNKHFYIHSMRHYFCSEMLRTGVSADFVKEIIAWESSDMVDVYNDLSVKERTFKGLDKLKAAMEQDKTDNN